MARGRPKVALCLSADERAQRQSIADWRSLPHALVRRARIVLASADGEPNSAIAKHMGPNAWGQTHGAKRMGLTHDLGKVAASPEPWSQP